MPPHRLVRLPCRWKFILRRFAESQWDKTLARCLWKERYNMIQALKGHAFHACMKKDDFGTRKTPKSSHFSQKNERI